MNRFFDIAGSIVRVDGEEKDLPQEDGILAPFAVKAERWDRRIDCKIVRSIAAPEGELVFEDQERCVYQSGETFRSIIGTPANPYAQVTRRGKETLLEVRRFSALNRIPSKSIAMALEAEHLIVERGGFLLHSSHIAYKGGAILFTAASQTGKSTQAELWHTLRGAEIINGDRTAVCRDGDQFAAYGIPFSGSSGISKKSKLPVKAIVCLAQSPQTGISRISGAMAFRRIWEGCSFHVWNRKDVEACSRTVMDAVSRIPIYFLACTPDESAVRALEEVL